MNLFKPIVLDIKNKYRNLDIEAKGEVKSTKYFPVFLKDGEEYIFKPLSKTKPFTTPLFAFSEVYWSYIINKYFDSNTPRYYLAQVKNIENEQPNYYEQGVLVESLTPNNEKLISLYDYFNKYPEPSVNIKDYINYCGINYDYTKILESNFIKNNKEIGSNLAHQILLSVLRQDQNFHYENINFFDNKLLKIIPPTDFEFSTPFLFPDNEEQYQYEKSKYHNLLTIKYELDQIEMFFRNLKIEKNIPLGNTITNNIALIVKMYPDTVLNFVKKLEVLIRDLPNIEISDPDDYIGPLNSKYWEVGHAYYKDNDLEKYKNLKEEINLISIDKNATFKKISSDILEFSKIYSLFLKIYLISYYNGINHLEDLTIKELLTKLNITDNMIIEDINIDTKELKLKKENF